MIHKSQLRIPNVFLPVSVSRPDQLVQWPLNDVTATAATSITCLVREELGAVLDGVDVTHDHDRLVLHAVEPLHDERVLVGPDDVAEVDLLAVERRRRRDLPLRDRAALHVGHPQAHLGVRRPYLRVSARTLTSSS